MVQYPLSTRLLFSANNPLAVWPGSSNMYTEVIASPRYEDFEIEYHHKNPWAHLGMGYAICNVKYPESDVSPYLQLENIDPKWLKAIGYEGPAVEVHQKREEKVHVKTDGSV
jgi:hypothetical protein